MKLPKFLVFSKKLPRLLQLDVVGPHITKAYEKIRSEKSSTDSYLILLMGYARSPFRDFESYLRTVIGLDEKDLQLILKHNNSFFIVAKFLQAFAPSKMFQKSFTQWDITMGASKLNMTILA